jgi:hypothetical protein
MKKSLFGAAFFCLSSLPLSGATVLFSDLGNSSDLYSAGGWQISGSDCCGGAGFPVIE